MQQPTTPLDPRHVAEVQQRLVDWYLRQGRDLPWRRTRDPYAILVAEVMLQQTQVDRVIPRWLAWLARFPTLRALAAASRADAIREWGGLGYNLRAVRLHDLALDVVQRYGGELPRSLDELQTLKGIGRYTAGAVACFAYEQPVAMVDTNVRRVLSRVFRVDPSTIAETADAVVPRAAAYAWNQALMDLGATVCRAQRPLCLVCPLLAECGGPGVATDTGGSSRKPAQAFAGSRRFYRGRIVDALRRLPPGAAIAPAELARELAPDLERERIVGLVDQLASEGLVVSLEPDGRVRLAG